MWMESVGEPPPVNGRLTTLCVGSTVIACNEGCAMSSHAVEVISSGP